MKKNRLLLIVILLNIVGFLFWRYNEFKKRNEITKVTITVPQTAYSIPAIIAIEKGFFKENDLDVSVNYVKTGKIAMDDLLGGKADFANIAETNVAFAGFNNPKIKLLATIQKVYDATIIARKDKGIKTEKDLRGKKVGVMLATTSQVYAEWFLEKHTISKDSVTMVNLLPPALQSEIIEGSGVDAISLWQPFIFNIQKALGDNTVIFKDKSVFTGYINLAGNADFILKNKDATIRLLKAYIKAEAFLKNQRPESIEIISRVLSIDKSAVESIWDEYECKISLSKELLDATISEGNWIIKSQKDFQGKQLPDYTVFFDGSYLKSIDENRVHW